MMFRKICFAVALLFSITLTAQAESRISVVGKDFTIDLDKRFNQFFVDNIPIANGVTAKTSFFTGNDKGMNFRIWLVTEKVGLLNDSIIGKTLEESVKGGYEGVLEDMNKNFSNVNVRYDKINTITVDNAPGKEILFSGTFNGQKVEGFVVSAYKFDKVTTFFGVATGLINEFSKDVTDIIDDTSDTIKLIPEDHNFYQVANNDFEMVLPSDISLKASTTNDSIRIYEFTGTSDNTSTYFNFNVVDAVKLEGKEAINKRIANSLKLSMEDYNEEVKVYDKQATVVPGEVEFFMFNDYPAVKQSYTVTSTDREVKGQIRVIYGGAKAYVISARTTAINGKVNDKSLGVIDDSLKTVRVLSQ